MKMETLASGLDRSTAAAPTERLRVVHILSGDRWAGAEVQAFTLLSQLQEHTDLFVVLMNDGELARHCRSRGINTEVFDENHMGHADLLAAVRSHLKTIKPHIVHTHRQKENIFGSLANLLTCRAKCVRTVHGAPEFEARGKQKLQVWLDRVCGRHLQNAVIAVSADLQRQLSAIFPARKLHLISNGIDPAAVKTGIKVPDFKIRAPEAVHIGLVGRLDPVKRVDIFLETAAKVWRSDPHGNWQFHVFGEGRQESTMKQLAAKLGLSEQVCFHGHRNDVRSCIAALDAVVMPSDHEGLPMAALETLALGVPLIAHDTGGLSELLKESKECLVKDHCPEAYAKALLAVIEQQTTAPPLHADYLASRNGEQVLALYRKLCRR